MINSKHVHEFECITRRYREQLRKLLEEIKWDCPDVEQRGIVIIDLMEEDHYG